MPSLVAKASGKGSALLSSVRLPTNTRLNGGLNPRFRPFCSDSRWKNRPSPARSDVLPSPFTSHAAPNRGAKRFFVFASDRLGPSDPPSRPASRHAALPGGSSMPLHGSEPSPGLNVDGSKLEIVSPRSKGFSKRDQRRP